MQHATQQLCIANVKITELKHPNDRLSITTNPKHANEKRCADISIRPISSLSISRNREP